LALICIVSKNFATEFCQFPSSLYRHIMSES
jgi:hypothetical protein